MKWHEMTIKKYFEENAGEVIFFVLFSLLILVWCFMQGWSFGWKEIEPISQPPIFHRLLYSALVYITLGAFLYWIKFYKVLHWLFVGCMGDWGVYNGIKRLVWLGLMLVMYFVIVP